MVFKDDAVKIDHGLPRKVDLQNVDAELDALSREIAGPDQQRTFGRMMTLVVYSEVDEDEDRLHEQIGEIIVRVSARAVLVRRESGSQSDIEALIRAHCLLRGEGQPEQCAEQVTLHVGDAGADRVKQLLLSLRLRDLPLVLWWRARPDPNDKLLSQLLQVCDQVILDSALFSLPAADLSRLVSHLRRETERIPFGDINWARLTPWRELIAQFFDVPEHLDYLSRLTGMSLEYSTAQNANPAQPMLITMWLATMLKWEVVNGTWKRDGRDRSVRLTCEGREIQVDIHGAADSEAPPGWLTSIALRATGEPPANFEITWCGEHCVTTTVTIAGKTVEHTSSLSVPDDVTLVCEEFDASRRDRVYHQALLILEKLLQ